MPGIPRFRALVPLLALLLLAAAAASADAKTKRFRPLDFVQQESSVNALRSPLGVGGVSGTAGFCAPLGLPAGATITAMRMHSNGVAAVRSATLLGTVVGSPPVEVAYDSTSVNAPDLYTPIVTAAALNPTPALRVISANMLYFIELSCSANTAIWAVDVDYTAP